MSVYLNETRCATLNIPYYLHKDDILDGVYFVPVWKLMQVVFGMDDTTYEVCMARIEECMKLRRSDVKLTVVPQGEHHYGWFCFQ